jgi:capsular exopolysaccharide synthesis family protein
VLTESVDATRTLLLRHAHVNSTKIVMIASATGGEGKTTLSCHLATSLARAGREVLLIDGDIRRPSVHRVFDLKSKPGFCEVLTGKVELPDALHQVSPAGLTVLTAGRVDADALRVLAQDKLGQMLDVARNQFDFVILDTSPILPVTDALLMAQFMDGVLFSIRRDVSRAAKVAAAVQRVSMLGVNILGAVAIGLDEGPAKSRYSYYHYGYGYGYGQNPHSPAPAPPGHRA